MLPEYGAEVYTTRVEPTNDQFVGNGGIATELIVVTPVKPAAYAFSNLIEVLPFIAK